MNQLLARLSVPIGMHIYIRTKTNIHYIGWLGTGQVLTIVGTLVFFSIPQTLSDPDVNMKIEQLTNIQLVLKFSCMTTSLYKGLKKNGPILPRSILKY